VQVVEGKPSRGSWFDQTSAGGERFRTQFSKKTVQLNPVSGDCVAQGILRINDRNVDVEFFTHRLFELARNPRRASATGNIEAREIIEPSPAFRFPTAPNKPLRRSVAHQHHRLG
jgi:hypothetical protein